MANATGAASAAQNDQWRHRVMGASIKSAESVLAEPSATVHHADRITYAKKIVENQSVTMDALVNTFTMKNKELIDVDQEDYGVTDLQIKTQIDNDFNFLAGIATGI